MVVFLRLLGGVGVDSAGEPLRGRAAQRRRLGLLALLAAHANRPLSRDKIIAYLWPEHGAEQARKLLSEALYVIRKELGDGAVVSIGDDLSIDAAVIRSDIADFR